MMKVLVKKILLFLFLPLRKRKQKRDGVTDQVNRQELPNAILLGMVKEAIKEGHTATIAVKGYSMRPFLEHLRDKVLLEPVTKPLAINDAILAEIHPGHYVLHRIIKLDGCNITMMGDGNIGQTESCTTSNVVGIVTEYIRPKRSIKADDPQLMRKIRLWRRLLPARRLLLVLYKASIGVD